MSPLCGAMCHILSSRTMNQLFNGANFVIAQLKLIDYFTVLVTIRDVYNDGRYYLHWRNVVLCFRPFIF